jgi:hypothetical protein
MFITLLLAAVLTTIVTSSVVVLIFKNTIHKILSRIVSEDLSPAIARYILFAIYVVGISGGVRIWELERYILIPGERTTISLTNERWILEVYRSVIESLQGIAWMLLVFFLITLIAYVIVRGFELKRNKQQQANNEKI